MKVNEITELLEIEAPNKAALEWDNVGLIVGDPSWEVDKVYIALDATEEVIDRAIEQGCNMLITHHPLIFRKMMRIVAGDFVGRRVMKLIENHVACYVMHTNFDIYRMGGIVAKRLKIDRSIVLDECDPADPESGRGLGRIGYLENETKLSDYAVFVKEALAVASVRVFGDPDTPIRIAAFLPGSGKSDIDTAIEKGADVMITGDIDHHSGIDAVEKGIPLIDAGHWGMEHFFIEYIDLFLKGHTGTLEIVKEPYVEPFMVF